MAIQDFIPFELKIFAIDLLSSKGFYRIHRVPPVDLRDLLDDPVEALTRSSGNPALINVPVNHCRGLSPVAFPCTKDAAHPFIETALGILNGSVTRYDGSPLQVYYDRFQPANLAGLLGLDTDHPSPLSRMSPYTYAFFPWDGIPNINNSRDARKVISLENKSQGVRLSPKTGWQLCGPVSGRKGELEFMRLSKILESIQRNGYNRHNDYDGDISGQVLVRGEQYVIIITPGDHRIAALAALGYENVPVRIGSKPVPIVFRTDVKLWPAVRSGMMSEKQALCVFDRVFEGRQPEF